MDISSMLLSMGLNMTSNALYDFIKGRAKSKRPTKDEVTQIVGDLIQIHGANVSSEDDYSFV
ncbi:MAG: hypothetical protein JXR30_00025 [Alphaproteobacteria bacterium]|nr:hypothetical protein [Alphaproteobacteria bacterium]